MFVVLYSGYIAFTNYGDGHNSSKEDAIAAIQMTAQERVPDSPAFQTAVLKKADLFLLVHRADGAVSFGSTTQPLAPVTEAAWIPPARPSRCPATTR